MFQQEMATAVSQGSILARPNTRSPVWEYFRLEANEKGQPANSDKAVCWLCKKLMMGKGGNTSNMRVHPKNHHPLAFSGLQKQEQLHQSEDSSNSRSKTKGLSGQATVVMAFEKVSKYV